LIDDDDECGAVGGMKIGKGNRSTVRKPALSTINPTSPDLGSNPDRRGGKPATNRLSYGAVIIIKLLCSIFNTILEFLRRWGIQTYLEGIFPP
jgi:hypothetical protein